MTDDELVQINIRVRKGTKLRLEAAAKVDRRSMADEADVLLMEALDVRDMGLDTTALRIAKTLAKKGGK